MARNTDRRGALRIILLFLDGVGIGTDNLDANPLIRADLPVLRHHLGGRIPVRGAAQITTRTASCRPINATLGMPGLPQSGTGQATLMMGRNAARIAGMHFGPYPPSAVRSRLVERNIFSMLNAEGRSAWYANAFPKQYFEYFAVHPGLKATISSAWTASGGISNDAQGLITGDAVSADITNERWNQLGYPDVPVITPVEAGRRLGVMLKKHHFVLYEYYFTDKAGHRQSVGEGIRVLEMVDRMLGGVIGAVDLKSTLIVITSDHGNLEDCSVKTHTRNPVPLIAIGKHHQKFVSGVKSITDVAPAIVKLLT